MKTNENIAHLIKDLKKLDASAWKRVASELNGSTRRMPEVNLSSIAQHPAGTVLVPGSVLGYGEITKAVTVAAFRFSKSAKEKITKAGGRTITINELAKENPKCSNVKIMV
ncbi:MAG: 50S ribosomal protein L18e [Candidatus Aenigmatarchaeota archaeon]